MIKHKLLIYERLSGRMKGALLLLGLILLGLGIVDLLQPILGPYWFLIWAVAVPVWLFWGYYAILMRRASVIVADRHMILQGPWRKIKFSYGRIASITSVQLGRHYPPSELTEREKQMLEPLYQKTAVVVELYGYPKSFKKYYKTFPRFIHSKRRKGLLLSVDDWMSLSRDLEARRAAWHDKHDYRHKEDKRSLAAKVLDL